MKNIFGLIIFLITAVQVYSQQYSGQVVYEKQFDVERITDKIRETKTSLKGDLLKELENIDSSNIYHLTFIANTSNYQKEDHLTGDLRGRKGGLNPGKFSGLYFFDRQSRKGVHQKEYFGELVIIHDSTNRDYKLFKETKFIEGYQCYKAQLKSNRSTINGPKEQLVTLWYTPDIPLPFGPENFNSLPGLILEVSYGNSIIRATEIRSIDRNPFLEIKVPKRGRVVSQEELDQKTIQILKERMRID